MTPPEKRLPGQSNDDYENPKDPNADFIGTHSIVGAGDPTVLYRGTRGFFSWLDRRKERASRKRSSTSESS